MSSVLIKNGKESRFGRWFTDEHGLPAFEYTCDQNLDPYASVFTTQGNSNLHWHQIGNDRITAIATNRGDINVIESSRGLQWLNYFEPDRLCPGAGIAAVIEKDSLSADIYREGDVARGYRRIFGAGYFRKIKNHNGIVTDNRLSAPFGNDPAILCEIKVRNESDRKRTIRLLVFFGVNLHFMIPAMIYATAGRKHYIPSATPGQGLLSLTGHIPLPLCFDAEAGRTSFAERFVFDAETGKPGLAVLTPRYTGSKRPARETPAKKNYYPYPLFLAALNSDDIITHTDVSEIVNGDGTLKIPEQRVRNNSAIRLACLCMEVEMTLGPGDSASRSFLFGCSEKSQINDIIEKYKSPESSGKDTALKQAAKWANATVSFSSEEMPASDAEWLPRETFWHSYYSRSAFLQEDIYNLHYVPQGGPYEFLHGFRGSIRDLALFAAGLIYFAPALTAELIEYCFRMMRRDGRLMYASMGCGLTTGAIVHEHPSDLQLFLLWALTDYVFFTRDFSILDRKFAFAGENHAGTTIRDGITLALKYLYDNIGLGPHGLIRAGDGDWSDGISLFVKNRGKFLKHGESAFNSAMALYVLPRTADLLESFDSAAASRA
ncbi:MAG TPA: hypothetical protein PLQ76_07105, partial [bacterium]|nr:hypothetical protein [bacterium]